MSVVTTMFQRLKDWINPSPSEEDERTVRDALKRQPVDSFVCDDSHTVRRGAVLARRYLVEPDEAKRLKAFEGLATFAGGLGCRASSAPPIALALVNALVRGDAARAAREST